MGQRTANDADRVLAEIRALVSVLDGTRPDRNVQKLIDLITKLDVAMKTGEDLPADWMYLHD